jgi:serine/threonine protein kinase
LENYNGPRLEEKTEIGEGASYKVMECKDRFLHKLVAVKRIKLPNIQSNQEAFEHRVTCVLRDIEVMHHGPLAQHENILRLLGYGWDYEQGDTIPFLVTELAPYGTLKEYLLQAKTTLHDRYILCGQVANGLNEMHMCGIAHGDLKLDNVLVCETGVTDVWESSKRLPSVNFVMAKIVSRRTSE